MQMGAMAHMDSAMMAMHHMMCMNMMSDTTRSQPDSAMSHRMRMMGEMMMSMGRMMMSMPGPEPTAQPATDSPR